MPPKSKCTGRPKETCKPPCKWKDDLCLAPTRHAVSPRTTQTRRTTARQRATHNPWLEHVRQYKVANPGISHREALVLARKTYVKVGGPTILSLDQPQISRDLSRIYQSEEELFESKLEDREVQKLIPRQSDLKEKLIKDSDYRIELQTILGKHILKNLTQTEKQFLTEVNGFEPTHQSIGMGVIRSLYQNL